METEEETDLELTHNCGFDSYFRISRYWQNFRKLNFDLDRRSIFKSVFDSDDVVRLFRDLIDKIFWVEIEDHYPVADISAEELKDVEDDPDEVAWLTSEWEDRCEIAFNRARDAALDEWRGKWGDFLKLLHDFLRRIMPDGNGRPPFDPDREILRGYLADNMRPLDLFQFEDSLETFSAFAYGDQGEGAKYAHNVLWKLPILKRCTHELHDAVYVYATFLAATKSTDGKLDMKAVVAVITSSDKTAKILKKAKAAKLPVATLTAIQKTLAAGFAAQAKNLHSSAREGAKSGVEKTLPKVYRKVMGAEEGDLDPLAPKPRAQGAGRKPTHDLDGKQVEEAYKRIQKNPNSISYTAICATLIRNPPKNSYKNPYTDAKALYNAVARAHPDIKRRAQNKNAEF